MSNEFNAAPSIKTSKENFAFLLHCLPRPCTRGPCRSLTRAIHRWQINQKLLSTENSALASSTPLPSSVLSLFACKCIDNDIAKHKRLVSFSGDCCDCILIKLCKVQERRGATRGDGRKQRTHKLNAKCKEIISLCNCLAEKADEKSIIKTRKAHSFHVNARRDCAKLCSANSFSAAERRNMNLFFHCCWAPICLFIFVKENKEKSWKTAGRRRGQGEKTEKWKTSNRKISVKFQFVEWTAARADVAWTTDARSPYMMLSLMLT